MYEKHFIIVILLAHIQIVFPPSKMKLSSDCSVFLVILRISHSFFLKQIRTLVILSRSCNDDVRVYISSLILSDVIIATFRKSSNLF